MSQSLFQTTGLRPHHFADLVRVAQIVCDLSVGFPARPPQVNWQAYNMLPEVVANLQALGQRYRFSLPHIPPEVIWSQLTPASREWLIENKKILTDLEEAFPARDED